MLDRNFQRNILEYLRGEYPRYVKCDNWEIISLVTSPEEKGDSFLGRLAKSLEKPEIALFHLTYLREHRLVDFAQDSAGITITPTMVRITIQGLDFIADDGGPSAITKDMPIKFEVDDLRNLVEEGMLQESVPKKQHCALKRAIRKASADVLQEAASIMIGKAGNDPVGTAKAVAGLFGVSW
jgi:hypothetical protein